MTASSRAPKSAKPVKVFQHYAAGRQYVLANDDCRRLLASIPDGEVSLTVTSPPYCIGKEYESSTNVEDFIDAHRTLLPEVARVTKPGGSICWQVGYHVRSRRVVPLDFLVYDLARQIPELVLRNRIVWSFGHGLHETERFTGRHETVLWFTKGDDYHFDLDAVRVPQKYPGKKSYKGPKKGEYSGNPLGKNPSDVWDIPNVKANHKEKTIHPCQFPIALAHRLIAALTREGDLVLDPFAGVGTTGAAAALLRRRFVGSELDSAYAQIARERMLAAHTGTLKYRVVEEPVMDPSLAGAVASRPDHFAWKNNEELTW